MEKIKISFLSAQRLLRIASKLIELGGEMDVYEKNTLCYMFEQCNPKEQEELCKLYGSVLPDLII